MLSLQNEHLFKFFRRWAEFYTLKSVKASTFCLFKLSAKGKTENHKSYLKAYVMVFLSVGAGFKIYCLEVSCAVGGRLFTRLWLRVISHVCRYFCRLGPAWKNIVLKFLVRLEPFIHLVVTENNYSTCRFGFCVSSKLNVLFSRRICEFCRTGVISHLRFRIRFSLLTVFQILYWVVA